MNTVIETVKHTDAANEDDYDLLDVNDLITGGREGFCAYTVTGDSTVEFIKQGYLVFVDRSIVPVSGDIVASNINGKLHVKILEKQRRDLFLVSANKEYKPRRFVEIDGFQIPGVVKGHLAVY